MIGGILSTLQNLQGGFCPPCQKLQGVLCPPCKKHEGCFVHLCQNEQGGFCPGGVLSGYHSHLMAGKIYMSCFGKQPVEFLIVVENVCASSFKI